ncbi:hypothetical protein HYC85_025548 [Camellia sinensis]|uniref:Uncharacterized protein n=1 Tax=Camellia sinensis TaxID=4442 RepID=A0A7J7GBB3_CAMSI|nr:hypothetical protein HYC85_025548 [Camellia sinensis]
MSASDPVTCVFASTTHDHPINLWDATSGEVYNLPCVLVSNSNRRQCRFLKFSLYKFILNQPKSFDLRSFNLENALASHTKANHSAGQYMDLKRELLSSN